MSAATRTAQILMAVDKSRSTEVSKVSKVTVVETPTESMDCKSPSKSKSKNKSKITVVETPAVSKVETPKKRGRPAGSKDKVKRKTKSSVETPTESAAERTAKLLKKVETPKKSKTKSAVEEVPKKKRGCPKGSHKVCSLCGETGHNKRTCECNLNALD